MNKVNTTLPILPAAEVQRNERIVLHSAPRIRIHQFSVHIGQWPCLKVFLWAHENPNAIEVTELVLPPSSTFQGELGHANLKNDELYTRLLSRLGAIRSESNIRNVQPRCYLATICRSTEFCNLPCGGRKHNTTHKLLSIKLNPLERCAGEQPDLTMSCLYQLLRSFSTQLKEVVGANEIPAKGSGISSFSGMNPTSTEHRWTSQDTSAPALPGRKMFCFKEKPSSSYITKICVQKLGFLTQPFELSIARLKLVRKSS